MRGLRKMKVSARLCKTLHSTDSIESMFSVVGDCEGEIKRYRTGKKRQRWLVAVLMYYEQRFRKFKGYESIKASVAQIKTIRKEKTIKAT